MTGPEGESSPEFGKPDHIVEVVDRNVGDHGRFDICEESLRTGGYSERSVGYHWHGGVLETDPIPLVSRHGFREPLFRDEPQVCLRVLDALERRIGPRTKAVKISFREAPSALTEAFLVERGYDEKEYVKRGPGRVEKITYKRRIHRIVRQRGRRSLQ